MSGDQCEVYRDGDSPLRRRAEREMAKNKRLIEAGVTAMPLLIDQGTADEFLADQLFTQNLAAACESHKFPLTLRWQEGYDHSYHFIATFIGEHLSWHAAALRA